MFDDIFSFIQGDMFGEQFTGGDMSDDSLGYVNEPIWNDPTHATIDETGNPNSPYYGLGDFDGDGVPNFMDHTMGVGGANSLVGEFELQQNPIEMNDDYYIPDFEDISIEDEFLDNLDNDVSTLINQFDAVEDKALTDFFRPDDNWHYQEANDTCAIAVQTDILNDFNVDVSEGELTRIAQESGYYQPGIGTPLNDVGDLLPEYGIKIEPSRFGHTMEDLIDAKMGGEKVLIGLDGAEIWNQPDHFLDEMNLDDRVSMGHAVEFKGIIVDDLGDKYVVIDDSGYPGGRNAKIPVSDFLDSWRDYNNFAVITDVN